MSALNGDRSRHHRLRKKKLELRVIRRALRYKVEAVKNVEEPKKQAPVPTVVETVPAAA